MNKILTLRHMYYAGSQTWFDLKKKYRHDYWLRRYGCGVIAMMDFCIYKRLIDRPQSRQEYMEGIRKLDRRFMHVIPGFGISIYFYSGLANMYYRIRRIPYRCRRMWFFGGREKRKQKMIQRITGQLEADMPLIFSAGPRLPFVGKKQKLYLYRVQNEAIIRANQNVSGHYMTITGLYRDGEEDYLQLASWGDIWYMNLNEYIRFGRYTIPFSNTIYQMYQKN